MGVYTWQVDLKLEHRRKDYTLQTALRNFAYQTYRYLGETSRRVAASSTTQTARRVEEWSLSGALAPVTRLLLPGGTIPELCVHPPNPSRIQ